MSVIRCKRSFVSWGYLYSHPFAFVKVLLPPPSIIYANNVHGAPMNPNNGTCPFNSRLVNVIASITYPNSFFTSTVVFNFEMSWGVTSGSSNVGPFASIIWMVIPMALGITRISQKMMDASRSPAYRWIGCSVIWHASSGVSHISKKSCCFRTSRNSDLVSAKRACLPGVRENTWEVTASLTHDPAWCTLDFVASCNSKD